MVDFEINLGSFVDIDPDVVYEKARANGWKLLGSKEKGYERILIWEKPDGFWVEEYNYQEKNMRAYLLVSPVDINNLVQKLNSK